MTLHTALLPRVKIWTLIEIYTRAYRPSHVRLLQPPWAAQASSDLLGWHSVATGQPQPLCDPTPDICPVAGDPGSVTQSVLWRLESDIEVWTLSHWRLRLERSIPDLWVITVIANNAQVMMMPPGRYFWWFCDTEMWSSREILIVEVSRQHVVSRGSAGGI